MDLYLLNELNKLEAGGASSGPTGFAGMFLPDKQDGTKASTFVAPILTRWNARYHYDNWTWSSSGPATSFYTYMENDYDCEFIAHSLTANVDQGDTNQNSYTPGSRPELKCATHASAFTWNNTVGLERGNDYNPFRAVGMFVKNPTNSSITHYFNYAHSNYWSSGHDGMGFAVGIPNSTDKASVTGINWSRVEQRTGQSSYVDFHGTSVSIPANKTCILLLAATNYYWTQGSQTSYFNDLLGFYNLHNMPSSGLEWDLDMTQTVHQGRIKLGGSDSRTNNFYEYWNRCAEHFPPAETP